MKTDKVIVPGRKKMILAVVAAALVAAVLASLGTGFGVSQKYSREIDALEKPLKELAEQQKQEAVSAEKIEQVCNQVNELLSDAGYENRQERQEQVAAMLAELLLGSMKEKRAKAEALAEGGLSIKTDTCILTPEGNYISYDPDHSSEEYFGPTVTEVMFDGSADRAFCWFLMVETEQAHFVSKTLSSWNAEPEYQVRQTKDGIFAFLFRQPENAYETVNGYATGTAAVTRFYENAFSYAESEVPLPLLLESEEHLVAKKSEENADELNVGKAYYSLPKEESIFSLKGFLNGGEGMFLEPQLPKEAACEYDFPALLLGLSNANGDLRTIYFSKASGKLGYQIYDDRVIFPRSGKLYAVKPYVISRRTGEDNTVGKEDYRKLLCAPLGVDRSKTMEKIFVQVNGDMNYDLRERPLYVGDSYICYTQTLGGGSGGSYGWSSETVRFDKLDDLSRFTAVYPKNPAQTEMMLRPNFQSQTLAAYVYGARANTMYQNDTRSHYDDAAPFINLRELAIARSKGKWSLMVPLFHESLHPGNGSSHKYMSELAVWRSDIPSALASGSCNSDAEKFGDRWAYIGAKDIISVPGGKLNILQQDTYLGVFSPDESENNEQNGLQVRIAPGEYIVSIHFASSEKERRAWEKALAEQQP